MENIPDQTPGPKRPWPQLKRGIARMWKSGRADQALRLSRKATRVYPDHAQAWLTLADSWLRHSAPKQAQEALEQAKSLKVPERAYLALQLRIHHMNRNAPGVIDCCNGLARIEGGRSPGVLRHLFRAYWDMQNWVEAEKAADALISATPSQQCARFKFDAVTMATPLQDLEQAVTQRLKSPGASDTLALGLLPFFRWLPPDDPMLARLAALVRDLWPDSPSCERLLDSFEQQVVGMGTLPMPAPLKHQTTTLAQDLSYARDKLARLNDSLDHPYPDHMHVFDQQVSVKDLKRPLVRNHLANDVLTVPQRGGHVVIALTSLDGSLGVPIEVLDAYLSASGTSAIYLKDFSRLFYGNGLRSVGPGFAEMTQALKRKLDAHGGYDSLTILGCSGAAHGAINVGLSLGADRVLAFSPITNASPEFARQIGEQRLSLLYKRLQAHVLKDLLDLRPRIAAHATPPRIDVIYGARHDVDRCHAHHLEGLQGVRLCPLSGARAHTTFAEIMSRGELPAALDGSLNTL